MEPQAPSRNEKKKEKGKEIKTKAREKKETRGKGLEGKEIRARIGKKKKEKPERPRDRAR